MTVGWFELGLRPEGVVADLSSTVPELADGRLTLLRCRISRIRSSAEDSRWTAVYELDVRDTATGLERTCVAHGVLAAPSGLPHPDPAVPAPFGTEGWEWESPELGLHLVAVTVDGALPGLAVLTDPEQSGLLLQETLRSAGWLDEQGTVVSCATRVLTHKIGGRATVLCRLEYADDHTGGPAAVVAKVHHDDLGERSFSAMRTLTGPGADLTPSVHVARPLAFVPGLRISLQEYADHGSTLKDLFHEGLDGSSRTWDTLLTTMRTTAAGLAALHSRSLDSAEEASWDDELAALRRKHADLASVVPEVAARTATVMDRLAVAAAATPADPVAPAHHSFRPAQVLLTGSGVTFIDFDKVCLAEPACDIALFTAKLGHMAANKVQPGTVEGRSRRVAELREAFLDEYRSHAPVSLDRVHLWEALELTSLVHSAAKKLHADWLERCDAMLQEHLAACGW